MGSVPVMPRLAIFSVEGIAMDTYDLRSWAEFRPLIQNIRDRYGAKTLHNSDGAPISKENQILFRGQSNSEWELKTTLERATSRRFDVFGYWVTVNHCVNELESLTSQRWNLKSFPEVRGEILAAQNTMILPMSCYDYLVYLRHHGFPSPLLDWTESPNIAAYFAYCERVKDADRVVVYAFIETPEGYKTAHGDDAMIKLLGPHVTTHVRHFAQKGWYTIATILESGHRVFCPHQDVFISSNPVHNDQDVLIKITLPAKERPLVLRELNDYNINHFTLYQSEDALVKALAMETFDLSP